jgi:hypothetical protein
MQSKKLKRQDTHNYHTQQKWIQQHYV